MSIYVACRCGQAFNAEPHLAGRTLTCPNCHQPLTVPMLRPAEVLGTNHPGLHPAQFQADPLTTFGPGSVFPSPRSRQGEGEQFAPWVLWGAVCGGVFAGVLILGLIIVSAFGGKGDTTATGDLAATQSSNTSPPLPAAAATPTSVPTPAVSPAPVEPVDPPAKKDSTPAAEQSSYGEIVLSADSQYEVWLPAKPSRKVRPIPGGKVTTLSADSAHVANNTYLFITTELPSTSGAAEKEAFFQQTAKSVKELGEVVERNVTFAGQAARELVMDIKLKDLSTRRMKTISFFDGRNGYTLQSICSGAGNTEIDRFWSSFAKVKNASPLAPPAADGSVYQSSDGKFEFWLPSQATAEPSSNKRPDGGTLRRTAWIHEPITLPGLQPPLIQVYEDQVEPAITFDRYVEDHFLARTKSYRIRSDQRTTVAGLAARDFLVEDAKGQFLFRTVIIDAGDRYFSLTNGLPAQSEESRRFFASFKKRT